jgi:preprotein translocase, SecE subunit, bacterial
VRKSIDSMKKIFAYIKESYNELVYKVSWPSKVEVSNSSVVVLIASLIIAAFILLLDSSFEAVVRFLYEKIL